MVLDQITQLKMLF